MVHPQISSTIPDSKSAVSIHAISPSRVLGVPQRVFLHPNIRGTAYSDTPCLCFLIEHIDAHSVLSRFLFDLGIRKDWENSVPEVVKGITQMGIQIDTPKDTPTILTDHNIHLSSIDGIFLSYRHFDHLGDPSIFPTSTSLIIGPGFKSAFTPAYPTNPASPIPEAALTGRQVIELDFSMRETIDIGDFQAIDYFSDGSLYILSTPGHAIGYISALARVHIEDEGRSSFILLAGDLCHHSGELRPSTHMPLPSGSISEPQSSGMCPSLYIAVHPNHDIQKPFYEPADGPLNTDPGAMQRTTHSAAAFDADPNVMVVLAHDNSLLSTIKLFPEMLNEWKNKTGKKLEDGNSSEILNWVNSPSGMIFIYIHEIHLR